MRSGVCTVARMRDPTGYRRWGTLVLIKHFLALVKEYKSPTSSAYCCQQRCFCSDAVFDCSGGQLQRQSALVSPSSPVGRQYGFLRLIQVPGGHQRSGSLLWHDCQRYLPHATVNNNDNHKCMMQVKCLSTWQGCSPAHPGPSCPAGSICTSSWSQTRCGALWALSLCPTRLLNSTSRHTLTFLPEAKDKPSQSAARHTVVPKLHASRIFQQCITHRAHSSSQICPW